MTILLVDFQDVFKSKLLEALTKFQLKLNAISAASIRHAFEIISKSNLDLTIVECSHGNVFDTLPIIRELNKLGKEFYVISDGQDVELYKEYTRCKPSHIFCRPLNITSIVYQIERRLISIEKTKAIADTHPSHFVFKWKSLMQKERYEDVIYISGFGNYITIHLANKQYKVRGSLVSTSKTLPCQFIRVHRNHIVNLSYTRGINIADDIVHILNIKIPIGRKYKKELKKRFTEFFKKT